VTTVICDELRLMIGEATDPARLARRGACVLLLHAPAVRSPSQLTPEQLRSALVVSVATPRGTVLTLGRHPDSDIVAPWPSVSRRHAALIGADGRALLVDRGSSNGTFVGGARLVPDVTHLLRDGDEIRFGRDLHAVFLTPHGLLAKLRSLGNAA
jgi:pSer/pThr/pTyr-binding forkhead associated (FHA) protein